MGSKRFEKKKPSRLWTMSANQARRTTQHLRVQGTNGYNKSNKRGDGVATMHKKWRTPLEEPSHTRVVQLPNDVARTSSSRLNNSKVSLQSDMKNARPSTSRANNGLGSRQKCSKPSSSRPNNGVVSSQKNRTFFSRSNNGSVSRENIKKPQSSYSALNNSLVSPLENIKKPQSSSSALNNSLVSPWENAEKPMPSSSRPEYGGTSPPNNIEMSRPSPSRPNNNMICSPKDIGKSWPSSSSPNGGSAPPLKNIERFMSANSMPSRTHTFIGPNDSSNSTFSISNKSPRSLVHGHSSNVEMSTQVQSEELWKAKEASTSTLALKGDQVMHGLQPQTTKAAWMSHNMEQNAESMNVHVQLDSRKQNTGKANDGKYKSKMAEPLLEEQPGSHVDDDSAKENSRPKKRMREDIYDDADDDGSEQDLVGAESGTAVITETAVVKDYHNEVSHHLVSESFKLRQYGSLPIDEPIWSGNIRTCSKEYVSLAAHLSTKYCDMVSKLSRSLQTVLEVTKLSRLVAWPKSFEASRPTDDNIALYFFPGKMRQDADLDQLVKEVVENDMVLRAVVDEAELLIFPSVLLPEQYRTFRGKPYLWGVFRPTKEESAIVEEEDGIGHCAQEEMEKQYATDRGVEKKGDMVARINVGVGLETPEEAEGQGMELEQTPSVPRPNTPIPADDAAWATSALTMPAAVCANNGHGATSAPAIPAAMSANVDGQIHSSFTVPTGAMQGMEQEQTPSVARPNPSIPVEDIARTTSAPTVSAAMSANVDGQIHSSFNVPTGAMQGMELEQTLSVARPNAAIPVEDAARATSAPTMPAAMSANNGQEATSAPTIPATMSANIDGQIHSGFSVTTGTMLGFVARQTPRLELIIEELQREGAIVVVMRGEMIGSGLGRATATV